MKKGDIVEGEVIAVAFPNKGKVQLEDRVASVKGVIKGQKVKLRIKRSNKERCQATLLEVVEPSPLENVAPKCPHFGACGGCSYQTMSYENQLKVKQEAICDLLKPYIEANAVEPEPIIKSPLDFAYRNKMEFSFGDEFKGGPLVLGMHKKNSTYDICYTSDCKIVNDDMTKVLKGTVEHFRALSVPFYHKITHEGVLRFLVVRRSFYSGELLVNLVITSAEPRIDEQAYVDMLNSLDLEGKIGGVLVTLDDSFADAVVPDETKLVYGNDYIVEELLGLKFKISPYSFFQTNSKGAEVLYDKVREYVGETKDKIIYDLYSGTGTIGQILAPVAKKVYGIEIVEEAVVAANENAKSNGLTHCHFLAGDVFKLLDEIEEKPDIIVLDPPRDGLSRGALEKIASYNVPEIVYVSCKPTSLLRDLEIFEGLGYHLSKLSMVDMYPNTYHTEAIAKLVKIDK